MPEVRSQKNKPKRRKKKNFDKLSSALKVNLQRRKQPKPSQNLEQLNLSSS
jgi:hypothetical protein